MLCFSLLKNIVCVFSWFLIVLFISVGIVYMYFKVNCLLVLERVIVFLVIWKLLWLFEQKMLFLVSWKWLGLRFWKSYSRCMFLCVQNDICCVMICRKVVDSCVLNIICLLFQVFCMLGWCQCELLVLMNWVFGWLFENVGLVLRFFSMCVLKCLCVLFFFVLLNCWVQIVWLFLFMMFEQVVFLNKCLKQKCLLILFCICSEVRNMLWVY